MDGFEGFFDCFFSWWWRTAFVAENSFLFVFFFFPLLNIKQILYTSAKTKKRGKKLKVKVKKKKIKTSITQKPFWPDKCYLASPRCYAIISFIPSFHHDLESSWLSPLSFIHFSLSISLSSISLYKYPVGAIDMSVHLWNISIIKLSAIHDLLLNKHCFIGARAAL